MRRRGWGESVDYGVPWLGGVGVQCSGVSLLKMESDEGSGTRGLGFLGRWRHAGQLEARAPLGTSLTPGL